MSLPNKFFLPYQSRWVNDHSLLKIVEKSRQIGWTYCTAYSVVRRLAEKSARLDAWISSRDEAQAQLFIEDCKQWAAILKMGAALVAELIRDIVERGNPMGWSHHKVTLEDAVAAGLVEKINAKKSSGHPSPVGQDFDQSQPGRMQTEAPSSSGSADICSPLPSDGRGVRGKGSDQS